MVLRWSWLSKCTFRTFVSMSYLTARVLLSLTVMILHWPQTTSPKSNSWLDSCILGLVTSADSLNEYDGPPTN